MKASSLFRTISIVLVVITLCSIQVNVVQGGGWGNGSSSGNNSIVMNNKFQIAFGQLTADGFHLYMVNSDGSGERFLGSKGVNLNQYQDLFPALSPDGSKIAFARQQVSSNLDMNPLVKVIIMSIDGKTEKTVGDFRSVKGGYGIELAWSPDSSMIAFRSVSLTYEGRKYEEKIVIASSDGKVLTEMKFNEVIHSPVWSPDGKKFAYSSIKRGIVILNSDEKLLKTIRAVGEPGFDIEKIYWSYDSNQIGTNELKFENGVYHAYSINVSNGIRVDLGQGYITSVSPKKNEFVINCPSKPVEKPEFNQGFYFDSICILDGNSKTRKLIATKGSSLEPKFRDLSGGYWSPDGSEIVIGGNFSEIWVMDKNGSNKRKIHFDSNKADNMVNLVAYITLSTIPSKLSGSVSTVQKPTSKPTPTPTKQIPNNPSTGSIRKYGEVFFTRDYCPNTYPSILAVGYKVFVNTFIPLKQRIRSGPGTTYKIIGYVDPGKTLTITDGPVCSNGWIWWNVQGDNGLVGWTAEGDGIDYWLIP